MNEPQLSHARVEALRTPGAVRATLAVVLMTKNEAARLADCLDRVVGWADELVVVDDLSTDRTVEIAQGYGAKVFRYASGDDHFLQWNRGIDHASADWILHIDADEWVTPELKAAIDGILTDAQGHRAFQIMRRNYFLGHPMCYGGWYHRHLILFQRTAARCVGTGIHVRLQVNGSIGSLNAAIDHFPFTSIVQFLSRQNRYTSVEAQVIVRERGPFPMRTVLYQVVVRPPKLFWKFFIKKRGYRDGMVGFVFSVLFAFTHFMLWAKCWEWQSTGRSSTRASAEPSFSAVPAQRRTEDIVAHHRATPETHAISS